MFRIFALLISLIGFAQPGFAQSLFKDVVNELTKEAARQGAAKVITESSQGSNYSGSRKEFADLQRALKARGFDPGVIDGLSGPSTRRAVRQYQAANGYAVTGSLTAGQTSRLLGGNSAAAGLGAVSILTPLITGGSNASNSSESSATGGVGASVGDLTTSSTGITKKQSESDPAKSGTSTRTETSSAKSTSQGDGDLLRQLRDEVAKTNAAAESGSQQATQRTRDTNPVQATTTTGSAENVSSSDGSLSAQQKLREQKRQEALCRRDPTRCPK